MKSIRLLGLLCLCLGLFVQVSAQASARPSIEAAQSMECDEEMPGMHGDMASEDRSADRETLCDNMALDCLVAMNCVSPLFITEARPYDVSMVAIRPAYVVNGTERLEARSLPPESPPPQFSLIV